MIDMVRSKPYSSHPPSEASSRKLCRTILHKCPRYALSRSMSPTMVAEYKRLLIPKEVLQSKIEEYAQIALDDTKDDAGKNSN